MENKGADYNNVGICASGLMCVLEHSHKLSVAKALLVMPLIMHDATVSHMSDRRIRAREAAALVTTKPELFVNFAARFNNSLSTSLNAIQLLIHIELISFEDELTLSKPLNIEKTFGKRALKIAKSSENIAALLASPAEELYLNLRIPL